MDFLVIFGIIMVVMLVIWFIKPIAKFLLFIVSVLLIVTILVGTYLVFTKKDITSPSPIVTTFEYVSREVVKKGVMIGPPRPPEEFSDAKQLCKDGVFTTSPDDSACFWHGGIGIDYR